MAVRSALPDASAIVELLLWLCDQLYSMLVLVRSCCYGRAISSTRCCCYCGVAAMAVRSALLDAVAMAGAIGISCALRCIWCYYYACTYQYLLCDQVYSMLLLWPD